MDGPKEAGRLPLQEYVAAAWETLAANKLRSTLALIGVMIAVAAIVGLSAVSTGSRDAVVRQLTAYGTDQFEAGYGRSQRGSTSDNRLISPADVEAVVRSLKYIQKAVPQTVVRSSFRTVDHSGVFVIIGSTPEALDVMGLHVSSGRFLSEGDDRQNVLALGEPLAKELFGSDDAVGQIISLDSRPFEVIGVVGRPSGIAAAAAPANYVFIPISTAQRLSGIREFAGVVFKVTDQSAIPELRVAAAELLAERHPGYVFPTYIVEHDADDARQVFDVLTKVIAAVTAIALVVGGIGVTNIMLVAVTERTREIGIRKAIGARRWDILVQFLTEAVTICLAGGILGLVAAWLLVLALAQFWFHFRLSLPPVALVWALSVSFATGLVAGVYPAVRAAALDPAEALRHE